LPSRETFSRTFVAFRSINCDALADAAKASMAKSVITSATERRKTFLLRKNRS
jgi:hypothetical protein